MKLKKLTAMLLVASMCLSSNITCFADSVPGSILQNCESQIIQQNENSYIEVFHLVENGVDITVKSFIEDNLSVKTVIIEDGIETVYVTNPEVIEAHKNAKNRLSDGISTYGFSGYWYAGSSSGRDSGYTVTVLSIAATLSTLSGFPVGLLEGIAANILSNLANTYASEIYYECDKYYAEETFGPGDPPIFYTKCIFDTYQHSGRREPIATGLEKVMKSMDSWY